MTEMKATRATITLGTKQLDGFMLPDGSYRLSQTQAAECVGKPEINARRFLASESIKGLLGEGYTPDSIEIDATQSRGQGRFNALPLNVVTAYWMQQSFQGNKQAQSLVWALLTESLERRFDAAFGVIRTEDERNDRLSQQMQSLERDLERLGEAYASDDDVRQRLAYLEQWIDREGLNPWDNNSGQEP